MENRKLVIFVLVSGLFIFSNISFAYNVPTHAFLTKAIVEFYNKNFSDKKISYDLIDYIIGGSRLEDNFPRYFNHFYDPINNRGLADGPYRGMASKDWSQNEPAQNALLYKVFPHTEASFLTAAEIQKLQPEFLKSNFTWQKAVDLYAKGEKEQALFALGHILHLIEDASVPEHTRNDAHPPYDDGGSPYENWTLQFTLENPDKSLTERLAKKKPILLESLNDYFDSIANYSNNNFYSKDSIKNYDLPKPDEKQEIGDHLYLLKKDNEFGNYYLAKENKSDLLTGKNQVTLTDDEILKSYWQHLSTKDVQYGAGVVNLFFKEGETAREKYLTEKVQRPYLATLIDGVHSLFGGGKVRDVADTVNGFKLVSEVPIVKEAVSEKRESVSKNPIAQKEEPLPLEVVVNQQAKEPEPDPAPAKPIEETKICSFSTAQSSSHNGVIINEVAWMGTSESSSNEWIELKNISSEEIDVGGWQLVDKGEKIKANLDGKIPAGGFYLLERTDETTLPGISANQIYSGALSNSDEGLRLFDGNCNLIDEVSANPDWPAGATDPKRTAERSADLSWHSSSVDGGTPKQENSPPPTPVYSSSGSVAEKSPEQPPASLPAPSLPTSPGTAKVLISEILFDAEGSDAGKEFLELYNPTDQAVDLSNWSIQNFSGSGSLAKKNFESGNSIAPKSFFLIWLGDDPRGDLKWNSGTLSNTSATIYLADNNNYVSTTSQPVNVVDSARYDVSNLTGFTAGKSLERQSFIDGNCATSRGSGEYAGNGCDTDSPSDFELRDVPNPQNKQSLSEPRQSPAAVTDFQIAYSSTTSELFFNWTPVAGAAEYYLSDLATTTLNSFTLKISETGKEYKFTIYAIDRDGLYSSSTEGKIFVEAPPPPPPQPMGISNVIFSHDAGGNYISFSLNDTFHDNDRAAIHYILVWLNEDPKEMTTVNRGSGINPNWAGNCPSTGVVSGNGGSEGGGGTGFDNYVMPDFENANKPPVYDPTQSVYHYKVYFTETCPSMGFSNDKDLKGELTPEDFVTVGLWYYYTNYAIVDSAKSINYPTKIYFQP